MSESTKEGAKKKKRRRSPLRRHLRNKRARQRKGMKTKERTDVE